VGDAVIVLRGEAFWWYVPWLFGILLHAQRNKIYHYFVCKFEANNSAWGRGSEIVNEYTEEDSV